MALQTEPCIIKANQASSVEADYPFPISVVLMDLQKTGFGFAAQWRHTSNIT
jgi:hypothetical protein